jgi:hypothetical protein
MSAFASMMGDAAGMLGTLAGQSVTYTTAAGASSTITAVIEPEQQEDMDGQAVFERKRYRGCLVKASDVASPSLSDKVTIGSEIWDVVRIHASGQGVVHLMIGRFETITKVQRGYFGKR